MNVHRFGVLVLVLCGCALLVAQQPVFHAEANYIEVDAVVTDSAGQFVPGLSASNFAVREANTPRSIDTFTYVDLSTAAGAAAAPIRLRPDLPAAQRVDADRIYLIYLDAVTTEYFQRVRQDAQQFVLQYMQPGDIAAVWNAEQVGQSVTFTNDHQVLIDQIAGKGLAATSTGAASSSAQGLRNAVDWLSAVQGRRKSLVLFAAGWLDPTTTASNGQAAQLRQHLTAAWGLDSSVNALLESPAHSWLTLGDLVERSDVHIYAVDVRGVVGLDVGLGLPPSALPAENADITVANYLSNSYSQLAWSVDNMRSLASATGGLAIVNNNDVTVGFARIVDDNTRYYLLGYHATQPADGRFHPITVSVTTRQRGLIVRARNGYIAR
jgi:VWFA-related protein